MKSVSKVRTAGQYSFRFKPLERTLKDEQLGVKALGAHGNMEFRNTESEKDVNKTDKGTETSEFQEAFDGGLESLTVWLEGLPKLQRKKVLELVDQSTR